jgi:hypothetical protein
MNTQLRLIARLKTQPRHGSALSAMDLLKQQAEDLYNTFKEGGKDIVRASGFTQVTDAVINAYEKVNILEQQNRKLSESFGVNTMRAAQLSKSFDKLGISINVNTDKLKIYAGELKKLFPGQAAYLANAGKFGEKIGKQAELMRNKLGLSAEVTEGYIRNQALLSSTSADNFENLENEISKYSAGLRGTYEGAFKDITQAIGELDAETAAVFGRNGKGLGNLSNAVLGAKKLGIELGKVLQTGTSFLDVESAIGSEIELQILGAKDLNVAEIQKARLQGDAEKLTKELTDYLLANGEAMKNNNFLLTASAEALGFSNSELLTMYSQLKINGKLEDELASTKSDRQAEIQKALDLENSKRAVKMTTLEEEIFLNNQLSESEKQRDKSQQAYAADLNKTDQVDQVMKLANSVESSMNSALTLSTRVVDALNNSDVIEKLIGASGFFSTVSAFIDNIKNTPKTGPGYQDLAIPKEDVFIPAGGSNTVVSGPKGSFSLDPDDDVIAMPNARNALANSRGGDASAIIAALQGMSFHVTNVFDGDRIQSSLSIRQGQKLNNIS